VSLSPVFRRGELAILVSHSTSQTAQGFQSFAIVLLNVAGSIVEVAGITRLNYQSVSTFLGSIGSSSKAEQFSSRHSDLILDRFRRRIYHFLQTRRLSWSLPMLLSSHRSLTVSRLAFFRACSWGLISKSLTDSPFEENFPLRHNTNRFIGVSLPSISSSPSSASTLSLLTSTASLLNLSVTPPAPLPLSVNNTSETYKTRKLKAKIEHAIYFGITSTSSDKKKKSNQNAEEEENLFKFDLQRDYEGDLAVAVEGVSRDLLASGEFRCSLLFTNNPQE